MAFMVLYAVSILLHLISLWFGLKCNYYGEDLFKSSSPKDFFKSRIEKKYWLVAFGMGANLMFLIVKPDYILRYEGSATGWQEPFWVTGHLFIGLVLAISHYLSYEEIRGIYDQRKPR